MNDISFRTYLAKIAFIFSLYVLLPVFLGMLNITGTFGTYLVSVICFLTLTIIASKLILGDNRYVIFFICAFLLEVTLGLVHYEFFVDTNYFESDGGANRSFWYEYRSVMAAVDRINSARNMHGALYWISAENFGATHPEIWHIISWPFYFMGHKWLNYSALNAFGTMLTSMNILLLYNNFYDYDTTTENKIKYWTAFFPTFLLCGTVWRDPFGIALVSIGIVLATLSVNTFERVISTLLFCSAAFVQRTMYTLLALISSFWGHLTKIKSTPIIMGVVLLFVLLMYYVSAFVNSANSDGYVSNYVSNSSILALPIKIVLGMIGPFPWTNFPDLVKQNPAYAWYVAEYLMGTFQLGYIICIIREWRNITFKGVDIMTIMGFGIMLSGFVTTQMPIGYISEGLIFTLPWYFSQVGHVYNRYFLISLVILIILNCLAVIFGSMGIRSLWH